MVSIVFRLCLCFEGTSSGLFSSSPPAIPFQVLMPIRASRSYDSYRTYPTSSTSAPLLQSPPMHQRSFLPSGMDLVPNIKLNSEHNIQGTDESGQHEFLEGKLFNYFRVIPRG